MRAAMSAQRNTTDRADAPGMAHLMRTGWYRQAHIKSQSCYWTRLLLTLWRNLQAKSLDLENAIRHSLREFGILLSKVGRGAFEKAVRTAGGGGSAVVPVDGRHAVGTRSAVEIVLPAARSRHQNGARSELCRRFMAIPGVGPVTALSFMTALDDRRASDIPAYFGQTSRRCQSGTSIDVQGRISKAGDADVRRSLTRRLRG